MVRAAEAGGARAILEGLELWESCVGLWRRFWLWVGVERDGETDLVAVEKMAGSVLAGEKQSFRGKTGMVGMCVVHV